MTRLLVAGLGQIGARHAAHAVSMPGVELAGVIEPVAGRGDPGWGPRFAAIDQVDIAADGIILATPSDRHADDAEAALARGWGVLVEKPLAATMADARRIVDAVGQSGLGALTGHHRRHHARVAALKALIDAGEIGRPTLATMIWAVKKPAGYFDVDWRKGREGSPVQINLVHEIDLLRYLFGDVRDVAGFGAAPVRGVAERVESGIALLQFDGGLCASVAFSDTTPSPWGFEAGTGENPGIAATGQDYLRITGTEGAVSFPSLTLWQGAADWTEAPGSRRIDVAPNVPLVAQITHFADVLAGAAPVCSVEEGLKSLEATLAVEEAILGRGVSA